ncbi:MAG: nucleotide sugar dehydrogenase [Sphingobacteriaceae bacterium]|nr:nucleotide sugar dehydrogenase [Sphingobacteriaceae bacterium]
MKIGIFGLDYVGIINAACFTKLGHNVIGCDIKEQKVEILKKGMSPIYEPNVNELLKEALDKGLLSATTNATEVVLKSDLLLICVGTPSFETGEVNLDFIFNTTKEIALALSGTDKKISIVYRSTMPPNTTEDFIRKILDQNLKNFKGNYKLAFYPEFLREGKAVDDFFNAPRIVIGSEDNNIDLIQELLSYNNQIPIVRTNTVTAEFVKYVDNCYHALKVAYVNEIYEIGKQYNVNIKLANDIFLLDRSLNISTAYLKPGLPFGGSCLPKDLRAITAMARKKKLDLPLLSSLLRSNQSSLLRLKDLIKATQKRKILFVGFTFKNFTDDYRESPILNLIEDLIKEQYMINIYDPDINLINFRIDKPSLLRSMETDLSSAINNVEVIVVSKRFMKEVVQNNLAKKLIINCSGYNEVGLENCINLY